MGGFDAFLYTSGLGELGGFRLEGVAHADFSLKWLALSSRLAGLTSGALGGISWRGGQGIDSLSLGSREILMNG